MQSRLMLLNRSSESDHYRALAICPESGQDCEMGLRATSTRIEGGGGLALGILTVIVPLHFWWLLILVGIVAFIVVDLSIRAPWTSHRWQRIIAAIAGLILLSAATRGPLTFAFERDQIAALMLGAWRVLARFAATPLSGWIGGLAVGAALMVFWRRRPAAPEPQTLSAAPEPAAKAPLARPTKKATIPIAAEDVGVPPRKGAAIKREEGGPDLKTFVFAYFSSENRISLIKSPGDITPAIASISNASILLKGKWLIDIPIFGGSNIWSCEIDTDGGWFADITCKLTRFDDKGLALECDRGWATAAPKDQMITVRLRRHQAIRS